MKIRLMYPGSNSMLEFKLDKGEAIKAESGAMVGMSSNVDVEGRMEGGILAGLGRALFSGENFFFQTLRATRGDGNVLLAPYSVGDVFVLELDGTTEYNVEKGGYLASEESITISTQAQNIAQGFFSGEGFFILKIGGRGKVALSSFGAIHEVILAPGEEYIVDNGHLVAWPSYMTYNIEKASAGWISSFTSGEGLVCRFRGPGKLYMQTRNPSAFGSFIKGLVPITKSSSSSSSSGGSLLGNIIDLAT
ncbi:MAG: TIGR00266 family protein [Cyanobacteriota bacterium]